MLSVLGFLDLFSKTDQAADAVAQQKEPPEAWKLANPEPERRKIGLQEVGQHLSDSQMAQTALAKILGHFRAYAEEAALEAPTDIEDWIAWGNENRVSLPPDADWALKALDRRPLGLDPDLGNIDLTGLFIGQRNLSGALLKNAVLDATNFWYARLNNVHALRSSFKGARLDHTHLNGARIADSDLSQARFDRASARGLSLVNCTCNGTSFAGADLRGALIWEGLFDEKTDWTACRLTGAAARHVDLSHTNLSLETLAGMFGDASVILPDGITPQSAQWPEHWARRELGYDDFRARWRKWQG